MTSQTDSLISQLTVKLSNVKSRRTIGTGILCYQSGFRDKVYILTASHCLFQDGDKFQNLYSEINVEFYNTTDNSYKIISVKPDENLLYKDIDKDVAILCIDKSEVEALINNFPKAKFIKENHLFNQFIIKGFPNATQGQELAVIHPIWKQKMTTVKKFQLGLEEDYNDYATKGFSGGGAFLQIDDEVYLLGIFTRFRPEDQGKVIYCQYVEIINDLLEKSFLPVIQFSYLAQYGFSPKFFQEHIKSTIENLGERYSEKLNFKLSIARNFNDIAKDELFYRRFLKVIDEYLNMNFYSWSIADNLVIEIEDEVKALHGKIEVWVLKDNFKSEKEIDIKWITDDVYGLNDKIEITLDKLYLLRREEIERNKDVKKDYSYTYPYSKEIDRLNEIKSKNNDFVYKLQNQVNVKLANNPFLIINGEAGAGKSHLLGDIANMRMKHDLPTIFLLGQNFSNVNTLEKNILNLIDVSCSFKHLLEALDDIGRQINSRVLILIDAINETTGSEIWLNQLAGLRKKISNYSNIGLVVSIRDTYFESIIPEIIKNDPQKTVVFHEGFEGNEYGALKLFCEYYNLEQAKFPILAPEFTKPLFLKLICVGVKNSPEKTFPNGFQGVNKLFNYYIESITKKIALKPEYSLRLNLVRDAINAVAMASFNKGKRHIPVYDALTLFEDNFPSHKNLLLDLIQEGIFIKNLRYNPQTNKDEEVIYFAYERFGDFYIGNELLNSYSSPEAVCAAFEEGGELGKLFEDYRYNGLLEAFSVILPEKFSLEIFEVYNWVLSKILSADTDRNPYLANLEDRIRHYLFTSLKFRTVESIDDTKLTNWISECKYIDDDELFYMLTELSVVENHPFNSDRLHDILSSYSMAERDGFWQWYIVSYQGYDDYNRAFPLRRLIDWAWTSGISNQISSESSRLAGQTLAWALSTTHKKLRDEVTKALVNLLEQQSEALISILEKFKNCDDYYILERLYAVAYGCVLRTGKADSIKKIAKYTYDNIFKDGAPIPHILLRDYARNIIEYALYKGVSVKINEKLIRPPYKTPFPELPSEEDVLRYKLDHDSDEYKKNRYGRLYNRVNFSVMEWDFGRKIVDPVIDNFSPVRFTFEDKLKVFKKSLKKNEKELFGLFETLYLFDYLHRNKDKRLKEHHLEEFAKSYAENHETIKNTFTPEAVLFIEEQVIPYWEDIQRSRGWTNKHLNSFPIKRWIVKRVFDLGYDVEIHGRYDETKSNFSGYYNDDVERISKKYQWIAYHEILAYLSDNYKMRSRFFSSSKYSYYKGTWQMFLRNIDPVSITKSSKLDDDIDTELIYNEENWWDIPPYKYWNAPNSEWAYRIEDFPDPKHVIEKIDDKGNEWVLLDQQHTWKEPKRIGKDEYSLARKRIWYLLQGYIIKKTDKNKIINYLKDMNLFGRWMPESRDGFSMLFNREMFWSPAYLDECRERKWDNIPEKNYKVIVATANAKGNLEDDLSGANTLYNVPCKMLFEGMNLQYAPKDGDFTDIAGELVVRNVSPDGTLIRKDKLFDYLNNNGLEIFWTLWGEKTVEEKIDGQNRGYFHVGVPCGVFHYENGIFKGEMKMYKRS